MAAAAVAARPQGAVAGAPQAAAAVSRAVVAAGANTAGTAGAVAMAPDGRPESRVLSTPGMLQHLLPWVGPGHYLQVACVCRQWRAAYSAAVSRNRRPCGSRWRPSATHPTLVGSSGQLSLVKWAVGCGCTDHHGLAVGAAAAGNHESLLWLRRQQRQAWSVLTCVAAARAGRLDTLRWLLSSKCDINWQTCDAALEGCYEALRRRPWDAHSVGARYATVLQWACGHVPAGWTACSRLCDLAALNGDLQRLQWARGMGCQWDDRTCLTAARGGQLQLLKWLYAEGCDMRYACSGAAAGGHLAVLKWAIAHGSEFGTFACTQAAAGGHLACLKWLRENGCPWDAGVAHAAAEGGHLAVLEWARQEGCPWDPFTCTLAAGSGHTEVLGWLRAQGCPWDEQACRYAVRGGHLATLQWLRAQQCPWDSTTCLEAAEVDDVACLQWAVHNGCPFNWAELERTARVWRAAHVLQWMHLRQALAHHMNHSGEGCSLLVHAGNMVGSWLQTFRASA